MAKLEALPLNGPAYLESIDEFNAKLSTHYSTWNCIDQHMRPMLERFFKDRPSQFRILSMGAGDGFCDFPFIEMMIKAFGDETKKPEFVERAVEPDKSQVEVFRTNEKKFVERLKIKADFEFLPISFQEYMKPNKKDDGARFDIVHFLHSIYYVDDLETALKYCYEKELGDKGVIIVNVGGLEWSKYRSTFSPLGVVLAPKSYTNHVEIAEVAKKNGWKYAECDGNLISANVTTIFDPVSKEGNRLLNFLTQLVSVRQTASPEMMQKILKYWETESPEDDQGRKIFNFSVKTVLIFKE